MFGNQLYIDQNDSAVSDPSTVYLVVSWIRASLLIIAWGALSFSDPPGGALYHRIKTQNTLSQ
jgi:hypothetical protein